MGAAMAAGLAQSENSRPQSSQDALDQSLGMGPYLLADDDMQRMIRSLASWKDDKNKTHVNPIYAAMAVQASYTPRASFMDDIDTEIGILGARMVFRRIKMKMSEQEYESGGALIADAILNTIVIPNYLSARGGFMVKMIKVSPKSMEVTYREDKGKKPTEGI